MKHHSRRKNAKRKYQHLMAALAGAAVVSSALLPGLPISKVQAADHTIVASPAAKAADPGQDSQNQPAPNVNKENKQLPDKEQSPRHDRQTRHEQERHTATSPVTAVQAAAAEYGFDPDRDHFSLDWQSSGNAVVTVQTDSGNTFKVHVSVEDDTWAIDSVKRIITGNFSDITQYGGDPVDVVKNNAATFGFDTANDHFTLLSMIGGKAMVRVKTTGQTFKVDLERSNGNWIITTIRGIGNSLYPATYRPASFYGYPTLAAATGPIATAAGQTLYSNTSFADWAWHESTYPADMKLGILLYKPEVSPTSDIPEVIVDKLDTIDFGRQLALYAHMGSVGANGYGIGIEKVVQAGNNLTVMIRMKSPLANDKLVPTKTNDVIPLDRSTLNFDNPIHITFIDPSGSTLHTYTLYK